MAAAREGCGLHPVWLSNRTTPPSPRRVDSFVFGQHQHFRCFWSDSAPTRQSAFVLVPLPDSLEGQLETQKYPVSYVHVTLPSSLSNLNVSPGKETVIIADEDKGIRTLLSSLSPIFPPSTPHSDTPTRRFTSNENISFDFFLSPSHLHFVTKDDDEEENRPSPLFSPRSSSSQSFGDTLTSLCRSPLLVRKPTLKLARDDSDDELDNVPITKTMRELTRDDSESEEEDRKTVRSTDTAKEKEEARQQLRIGWLKHAKMRFLCSSIPFRIAGMVVSSSLRLPILSFATPNTLPASPFDLPLAQPTQPSFAQQATQQQPSQFDSLLLFVFNPFRAREFARDEDRMGSAQPVGTAPEGGR
ncbi:hypothetical protein BLNAU_4680 [Blattamonas nauphoetae]|uniref:Uncharacterized protein n=1 Tax=Blattamonas nauphoetae TaxID=2049346 RepID=A0ABQ9Y9M0_9EUKA|nr:hypothetical protein BLNAU_4680 [Blattamonas nauphoetae]